MGMSEKNKQFFNDLITDNNSSNKQENEQKSEEYLLDIDIFKMHTSFLKEKEGIILIISEICNYSINLQPGNNKTILDYKSLYDNKNRTIMLLSSYQEMPGLLDPILPNIIPKLSDSSLKLIEKSLSHPEQKDEIFKYILFLYEIVYSICKIRGYIPILKFFSSEVSVFENVIHFLIKLPYVSSNNWYVNYVLILWTSLLSMVPFDIDTIDTQGELINNLLNYLKQELIQSSNLRDITSYAISKFLIRPDLIKKNYLDEYINFCVEKLTDINSNNNIFVVLGILLSLFDIFKNGQQNELTKYLDIMINKILPFEFPAVIKSSGMYRKTLTKLIQRVGIVLLKPRPQTWRYHLNLKEALHKEDNNEKENENINQAEEESDVLDYDLNYEFLETIIDYLINKLSDKEYIVRWSAAKGLGRICERLTKTMVEEIFKQIFDLFSDNENEYAWHGACLCIAELCKRGMILPERLNDLIPYLEKALLFEINKGTFCTGSNVRDAACYIVWALARAFTTDIMKKYVDRLAGSLILTILFDKEVNCRRAASAAFQENVGRQGNFPHGIEILTEADYFTLGMRTNCYLNISIFIAQYETYYKDIVNYLAFNRLIHIEKNIRELSAETLALLVPFNSNYFVDEIIPKLMKGTLSSNLSIRHGSLIGIGHILLGLNGKWDFYHKSRINRKQMLNNLNNKDKKILEDSEYRKKFDKVYETIKYNNNINLILEKKDLINDLINLISKIDNAKLYRGKGSEIMRNGVNKYIKLLSEVHLPITPEIFLYYHEILIDNVRHSKNDIQEEACETLRLFNLYYGEEFGNNEQVIAKLEKIFIDIVNQSVTDDNIHVTKGYNSCMVNFNKNFLLKNYGLVLNNLIKNSRIQKENKKTNDSLTRKAAIESLGYITIKFINEKIDDMDKKLNTIIESFNDYEMDPRIGDVGSNVRIAASIEILRIMIELYKNKKFDIFEKYIKISLNCLIRQLAEKIALVRRITGNELQKFFFELKDENLDKYIPNYNELKNIFLTDIEFDDDDKIFSIKWIEPEFAYPKIIPLIELEEYQNSFIEGYIRSIACISEDVHKCSMNELKKILDKNPLEKKHLLIKKILDVVLLIFKKNEKDDKFIEPLESALAHMFSMSQFINNEYLEQIDNIYKCVIKENFESKNIHKILNSVDIFYSMLFFEKETKYNLLTKCLRSLLLLMCHKYPVVRKKASEKLFLFLTGLDETNNNIGITEEQLDNANILIADTDWTLKVIEIKESRNKLAQELGIDLNLKKTK